MRGRRGAGSGSGGGVLTVACGIRGRKLGITSLWKSAATESKQKKEVEGLVNEIEKVRSLE